MITEKEKQSNAVSKQATVILAAYWGFKIHTVFSFLDHYGIKYSWHSTRTAYYKAKWKEWKKPIIKKDLEKKLYAAFKMIEINYPKIKKPRVFVPLDIQGEYSKSINALIDEAQGKKYRSK